MDADFPNIRNFNIAAKKNNDTITFLRRIVSGPADDSYGIEVAKLAGIPESVTERAKEILHSLESQNPDRIERKIVTLQNSVSTELENAVRKIHLETLTPLEAMNVLHSLIQIANKKKED